MRVAKTWARTKAGNLSLPVGRRVWLGSALLTAQSFFPIDLCQRHEEGEHSYLDSDTHRARNRVLKFITQTRMGYTLRRYRVDGI